MKFAIVGSGLSGCVIANHLANIGHSVSVFESRDHIGGNCYTERDKKTGVMTHKYGPHIFHTKNKLVWDFVSKYIELKPYNHRVKTTSNKRVYSLPINLLTINQYFDTCMSPNEAKEFIRSITSKSTKIPLNFEEQALQMIGKQLYESFFKGYTLKQWGEDPINLPASILKRLPMRFNYNDNYFNDEYQGMPKEGYTPLFEKLTDHKNIELTFNKQIIKSDLIDFDHTFYTGTIDSWFNYTLGRLGYRSLIFEKFLYKGDFQGCSVMNYSDEDVPYTRITEHKHFTPWENHEYSVIYKEYSKACEEDDIPYYPIRLAKEKKLLNDYYELAEKEESVSFLGRLGTYRYMDMDLTIYEALKATKVIEECLNKDQKIPCFFHDKLA